MEADQVYADEEVATNVEARALVNSGDILPLLVILLIMEVSMFKICVLAIELMWEIWLYLNR